MIIRLISVLFCLLSIMIIPNFLIISLSRKCEENIPFAISSKNEKKTGSLSFKNIHDSLQKKKTRTYI